jgi:uridine kinase
VLVVEGTYALGLEALDVRVFCTATHVETRARRAERNRDLDDPIIERILELEHQLIAPYGATADIRIDFDFRMHRRR